MEANRHDRGLLDLSVELSTRDIMAGNEFTLFVLIKNPFTRPVWVRRVHVSLPSELRRASKAQVKVGIWRRLGQFADRRLTAKADQTGNKETAAPQFDEEQKKRLEEKIDALRRQMALLIEF